MNIKLLPNPKNKMFNILPKLGLVPNGLTLGEDFTLVLQSNKTFMLGNSYYDIAKPKNTF